MALPERAVLAVFAAGGRARAEAEASHLWPLALASRGGSLEALRLLKAEAGAARARWIQGGSVQDLQVSYLGRALPVAPPELKRAAIEQFRCDTSSAFETDPQILASARSYACAWARAKVPRFKRDLSLPDWPSSSSCYERSAGKGGTLQYLLDTHAYDDIPVDLANPEELEGPAGSLAGLQGRFVQAALEKLRAGEIPTHRLAVLGERGLKTRVVTVGPSWTQTLGHALRRRLYRALRTSKGTKDPLDGAGDDELIQEMVGGYSEVLVSSDLTRATDLLPHDLVTAITDGLADSGRLSPLEVQILKRLSGPQKIEGAGAPYLSVRGILMGQPVSWALLSIIHLWWMDSVARTSPAGPARRAHRWLICGDDALLATTQEGANRYKSLVRACGGSPSEGKHYEVQGGRRAIFLERAFTFEPSEGRLTAGNRVPVIPVKGLTSGALPRTFAGDMPLHCRSFGIAQVIVIDSIAMTPCLRAPLERYVEKRVPWIHRYALEAMGLSPGHPLRAGGWILGSRTPEGDQMTTDLLASGRTFSLTLKRSLDPAWRMAACDDTESFQASLKSGGTVDLGLHRGESSAWQLPLDRLTPGLWIAVTERDRSVATTTALFYQYRSFLPPKVQVLRSSDFVKTLSKLRRIGRETRATGGQPPEEPLDDFRPYSRVVARRVGQPEGVITDPRSEAPPSPAEDPAWISDLRQPCLRVLDLVVGSLIHSRGPTDDRPASKRFPQKLSAAGPEVGPRNPGAPLYPSGARMVLVPNVEGIVTPPSADRVAVAQRPRRTEGGCSRESVLPMLGQG
jgi:hypothetical protein